jgi:hypothetical protein
MGILCFEWGLGYWIEAEAEALYRDLLPSRRRSRYHRQLQDELLVEVGVADCCSVLVDRSHIVRGSVDTRYRPGV